MARRRRTGGRRMAGWRKAARSIVGIAGKALGLTVVATPAIQAGVKWLPSGNVQAFGRDTVSGYTGYDPGDGRFIPERLFQGVGYVVGGIVVMKLFGYLAKRI